VYPGVPGAGIGFIVMVGKHPVNRIPAQQVGEHTGNGTVKYFQGSPHPCQFSLDFPEGRMNEFHPPVLPILKPVKYFRVKNKYRHYRTTALERLKKGCVIMKAKISPKPEDIYQRKHLVLF
jgi:hypothetical protein